MCLLGSIINRSVDGFVQGAGQVFTHVVGAEPADGEHGVGGAVGHDGLDVEGGVDGVALRGDGHQDLGGGPHLDVAAAISPR